MRVYAVNKDDFIKYRTTILESMQRIAASVSYDQVITQVKFSTEDKDFSVVDSALLGILRKQYDTKEYITQNDLDEMETELNKIEENEVETLSEVLWAKGNFDSVEDIINVIKNIDNYMMLYLADEESLGYFIVKNLDIYKMPQSTLDNIAMHLNFKDIAKEYLFTRNIEIIQIEDIVLDISKNKEDELIQRLIENKIDSRTIRTKNEHEETQEAEEDSEFEDQL